MTNRLGSLLREWRTARGLSVRGLALKAGIGRSTLSYWETGVRQPSVPELEAVLDALNATRRQRAEALARVDAPRAVRRLREVAADRPPVAGELLRAMRLRRGWTQAEVASRAGVRQNTIARWERSEDWPSPEHLHALCFALEAQAEEVAALTCGRFAPSPPAAASLPLEALVLQLYRLLYDWSVAADEALKDLRFLALEALLWSRAGGEPAVRFLLASTYARHAAFLADRNRFAEVPAYAERALSIAEDLPLTPQQLSVTTPPELSSTPTLLPSPDLVAVCAAARAAALGGKRPAPARGARLLRERVDRAASPDLKAWMLSDLAEYLAADGDLETALAAAKQACREVEGWPHRAELHLRQRGLARLLIRAGRAAEALPLLPIRLWGNDPTQRVQETQLWAEATLALGDTTAAHEWLRQTYAIIDAHGLTHLRSRADQLAQRL